MIHPLLHLLDRQRRKPEPRTPTLNRRYNLIHIITDNAEPDVLRVLLDDASEGGLGGGGHHVGFVEDDEFEAFGEEGAGFGELFDLFADDVDAAVVGGVELERYENNGIGGLKWNRWDGPQGFVSCNLHRIYDELLPGLWTFFPSQEVHRTADAAAYSSQ